LGPATVAIPCSVALSAIVVPYPFVLGLRICAALTKPLGL
jgi:hypothetical protein